VNPARFPNGLETLAEYVKAKAMEFGLWFDLDKRVCNETVAGSLTSLGGGMIV